MVAGPGGAVAFGHPHPALCQPTPRAVGPHRHGRQLGGEKAPGPGQHLRNGAPVQPGGIRLRLPARRHGQKLCDEAHIHAGALPPHGPGQGALPWSRIAHIVYWETK